MKKTYGADTEVPPGVLESAEYVGSHARTPFYEKDGVLFVPKDGTLKRVESKSARTIRKCID